MGICLNLTFWSQSNPKWLPQNLVKLAGDLHLTFSLNLYLSQIKMKHVQLNLQRI